MEAEKESDQINKKKKKQITKKKTATMVVLVDVVV